MESRIRHRKSLVNSMHGYHLTEYFRQSTEARRQLYVQRLEWWLEYETPKWLCVPTVPFLAYFGSLAHESNPRYQAVCSVALCR